MKSRPLSGLSVAIAAAAFLAFQPSNASAHSEEMKMGPRELMKQELAGLTGQEAKVIHFRVPAGWTPPKHLHPGHLFLYMLKGSVTLKHGDGTEERIGPGDVVYEEAGTLMNAGSAYSEKGAEFLVFNVGAIGDPVMKELQ